MLLKNFPGSPGNQRSTKKLCGFIGENNDVIQKPEERKTTRLEDMVIIFSPSKRVEQEVSSKTVPTSRDFSSSEQSPQPQKRPAQKNYIKFHFKQKTNKGFIGKT